MGEENTGRRRLGSYWLLHILAVAPGGRHCPRTVPHIVLGRVFKTNPGYTIKPGNTQAKLARQFKDVKVD